MKNKNLIRATAGLAVLCAALAAWADVITLSDGSRLQGTIEEMGDGKLKIVTQFAGTLEIDAAMVTSVSTEEAVNVDFSTGDRLVGPVSWQAGSEKATVKTQMGPIAVDSDKIEAIWQKGGKSPEERALERQIEEVKAEAEAARPKWSATFEAGLLVKEGNKDVFNARGKAELVRKSADDLLKFYVSGEYAEENDDRSASEVKAGAYYEYLFNERCFAFGQADVEYDEFENLDLRFSMAFGPGYYWIKEKDHELKTRAGVGYLHETYRDDSRMDKAEALVGLDYRVEIAPWLRFTNGTTWYPTFEGLRDYRLVSDSAIWIPLGDSEIWKIKLGALYEYDSIPDVGFERLDQTYYANLVLELK